MGDVETAVRAHVKAGDELSTAAQGAKFSVAAMNSDEVVLLFGQKETRTRISWKCLEGIVPFLKKEGEVGICGTGYSNEIDAHTLDGYLKQFVYRATAGWVAALLEEAGIVSINRTASPLTVRLSSAFQPPHGSEGP